jgi:hypothetical protein
MYQMKRKLRIIMSISGGVLCLANAHPNGRLFIERPGEPPAAISLYQAAGSFHNGETFSVNIKRTGKVWRVIVKLNDRKPGVLIIRSTSYLGITPHLTSVVRAPGIRDSITVRIPSGPPQTDCFENGEEVREQIIIDYAPGSNLEVSGLRFIDCVSSFPSLRLWKEGRVYVTDGSIDPNAE